MSTDDQEILLGLKAGGETAKKAFNTLVKLYQRKLYWVIRRMVHTHDDTDDALQNTLIKVWKNAPNFRGDSALFSWMYRIAVNESISLLKNKHRINFVDLFAESDESPAHEPAIYETQPDWDLIEVRFKLAIEALPPKQRIVFNMKYFDDVTFDEMSAILGTSSGALKASYHHASKKIESFLCDH